MEGVNLYTLMREKELGPEETKRIVVEICQALQFAHDEGIVHRDIKPSNILIDKKGRVKIADFGLAKLLAKAGEARQRRGPQPTLVMGTPNYMAPEQVERPLDVDHRADLYSLGVVFYEMLTLELPMGRFEAPSRKAKLDGRLDGVVMRALEKEPTRRFQSATQIRQAVEALARPKPPGAPEEDAARPRAPRWAWLRQLGLMTGSAVIALTLYFFVRSQAPARAGRIPASAVNALEGAPEGRSPALRLFRELQLTPAQTLDVNRIVRRGEQEFLRVERRHTERAKDAKGHLHVTIAPFPEEMTTLMNEVWTGLGGDAGFQPIGQGAIDPAGQALSAQRHEHGEGGAVAGTRTAIIILRRTNRPGRRAHRRRGRRGRCRRASVLCWTPSRQVHRLASCE